MKPSPGGNGPAHGHPHPRWSHTVSLTYLGNGTAAVTDKLSAPAGRVEVHEVIDEPDARCRDGARLIRVNTSARQTRPG